MDAATLNQHLEKHLRVSTFPLGIKSLKPGEPLPRPHLPALPGRLPQILPGTGKDLGGVEETVTCLLQATATGAGGVAAGGGAQ